MRHRDESADRVEVRSPVPDFTGPGPADVVFEDGRAQVPTDAVALLGYFRDRGYGVGEEAAPVAPMEAPDSREIPAEVHLGTELRDAAVNPTPGDYLAPIGAGQDDPHGRMVVAPTVHGEGPGPITPGAVADDPKAQAKTVAATAAEALTPPRAARRRRS